MAKRGRKKSTRATWGKVRQLASGKFQASYTHGGAVGVVEGQRYNAPGTFDTEGDARIWLKREKELIDSDSWKPPAQRVKEKREAELVQEQQVVTFGEYATTVVEESGVKRTTDRRYRKTLDYYILGKTIPARGKTPAQVRTRNTLADTPLTEVTKEAIGAWWKSLPIKEYERSCHLAYQLVEKVCRQAVADDLIEKNPCKVKEAGKPSKRRTVTPLTFEEVERIANAARSQDKLIILIGAYCGMRPGEILELKLRNIRLLDGYISVNHGVSYVDGEHVVDTPKTGIERAVPIPPEITEDFENHLKENMSDWGDDALLFTNTDGGHVLETNYRARFIRACKKVGITGYTPYDLRRTIVSQALANGASTRDVMDLVGHVTPSMTLRYANPVPDNVRRVTGVINSKIADARAAQREQEDASVGATLGKAGTEHEE